jgi:hypothetical protein
VGTRSTRCGALAVVLVVAALALLPATARASLSPLFTVSGAEYAATSTEGRFFGFARGSAGETGFWHADVLHQPLATTCYLTSTGCAVAAGGSILVVTSSGDIVSGAFTGGSITLVREAPGCGTLLFHVVGQLQTSAGSAVFDVALTHNRVFFGSCVTVSATVGPDQGDAIPGTLSFSTDLP